MPKISKLSKKLNVRKGQILFVLSGIHAHLGSLMTLITCYIDEQAKSENQEEHLTPAEVFFLQRFRSGLNGLYIVAGNLLDQYRDSTLIKK